LSKSDPTDNVLAAIASIFDQTAHHREPENPRLQEKSVAPEMVEAGGYQKSARPIAAIRFNGRSAARLINQYFGRSETIGENSAPVVSGPLTGMAAIRFRDERERRGAATI